ncbi:interleukin-12 subunit alpha [Clarias gariepinus]|uniref:interleukin-12 subunit alpha n=1 Tax=Clarias gariepinus TaxID=13013 RepID=UPI00234C17AE|nr:interleukin-12 subunit alpha [Clarias gariepinus]
MSGSLIYVLILALMSRATVATPVRVPKSVQSDHAQCTTSARDLLTKLRGALEKPENRSNTLFHGFNCTELEAVVNPNTQTASVCQPSQVVKCSDQRTTPFNETECLQNIDNDLKYHRSMLDDYVKNLDQKANSESIKELNKIRDAILELKQLSIYHLYLNVSIISFPHQSCKLLPTSESSQKKWSPTNSFEDRKDLCKQLKGFEVRIITINRALGYICAGDHKK